MGFIYKATYRVSGKAYIGQTIRPIEKRMLRHQQPSSKCKAFLGAIQKHGWENFDVEWYEIPDEDLNFYEEMLVALLGTLAPGGYNLKEGGGARGKMSDVSKQKMREAWTIERKQKLSEANSGKTLAPETKQKLSEAQLGEKAFWYGKTRTPDTKQKISEALAGEKHPMYGKNHIHDTKQKMSDAKIGANNHASKTVYRYDLDGTYVDSFGSGGEAARRVMSSEENERSVSKSIRRCVRGDRKDEYNGFRWSYKKMDHLPVSE
jgi:group I intron endonuclease